MTETEPAEAQPTLDEIVMAFPIQAFTETADEDGEPAMLVVMGFTSALDEEYIDDTLAKLKGYMMETIQHARMEEQLQALLAGEPGDEGQ